MADSDVSLKAAFRSSWTSKQLSAWSICGRPEPDIWVFSTKPKLSEESLIPRVRSGVSLLMAGNPKQLKTAAREICSQVSWS